MKNILKVIGIVILAIISLFSLGYYATKFYSDGTLKIEDAPAIVWIIFLFCIFVSLGLGIYNAIKNEVLISMNKELMRKLEEIQCENKDIIDTIDNSRDISLDIYNKIKGS